MSVRVGSLRSLHFVYPSNSLFVKTVFALQLSKRNIFAIERCGLKTVTIKLA